MCRWLFGDCWLLLLFGVFVVGVVCCLMCYFYVLHGVICLVFHVTCAQCIVGVRWLRVCYCLLLVVCCALFDGCRLVFDV